MGKHECLYDDSQKLVQKLRDSNTFKEIIESNKEVKYEEKEESKYGDAFEFNLDGDYKYDDVLDKELIYCPWEHMPHAFVIFPSVFPEANDAMSKVCLTLDRWFK